MQEVKIRERDVYVGDAHKYKIKINLTYFFKTNVITQTRWFMTERIGRIDRDCRLIVIIDPNY